MSAILPTSTPLIKFTINVNGIRNLDATCKFPRLVRKIMGSVAAGDVN
jgi:hypothetical protein